MKRTHPKTIGEILEEFFQRPHVARKLAEGHLPDYWQEIVGLRVAAATTDLRLENGILYICVSSGVIRQELFFQRDMLVAKLNARAGHNIVRSIVVR